MRTFIKDFLEPFCFLIYAIAMFISIGKSRSLKKEVLFVYYLLVTFIIAFACYTISDHLNRILYNIYYFITIATLTYYFRASLTSSIKKKVIGVIFLIHLPAFAYICFVPSRLLGINNYYYAFTYLSIVVYALFYFEQVMRKVSETNILHEFDFWLSSGYLLYFLSCFFVILFYENIDIEFRAMLWSLQNIILLVGSFFTMAGSIWIRSQQKY